MKRVLGLLKAHAAIVVFLILMLAVPPVCWVFASKMNAKLREEQQTRAAGQLSKINGLRVNYQSHSLSPSDDPVQISTAPNQAYTEQFAEYRKRQQAAREQVEKVALEFNQRGQDVLVEGLFPEPAIPSQAQSKAIDMAKAVVPSSNPSTPTAYQKLLREINAGGPPSADEVALALEDFRQRELERFAATQGQDAPDQLPPEVVEEINDRMRAQRIGAYQRRAQDISIYATVDALPPTIPRMQPTQAPTVEQSFEWQFDYWVISDVLRAIDSANVVDGQRQPVESARVKRLISMDLEPLPGSPAAAAAGPGGPGGFEHGQGRVLSERERAEMRQPAPSRRGRQDDRGGGDAGIPAWAPPSSLIERDYSVSISGLVGGSDNPQDNQLYDVRRVMLSLIVDSSEISQILDSIQRWNYMEVIDFDMRSIDPWADLARGYAYGPDHVVELDLTVDTVWLREWTREFMPKNIRERLKVAMPEKPKNEDT